MWNWAPQESSELKRKAADDAAEVAKRARRGVDASAACEQASGEEARKAHEHKSEDCTDSEPDVVTFEVQGENFKVLASTIRMQPDTLLCTLLDTEDLSKPIFVEGDKALFPYILSWYRHASSMRINVPITVSKAAMEQACRTFGLPDGVQVQQEWESCTHLVEAFARSMQSKLEDIRGSAQKQQALADQIRTEATLEVQQAIQALEEKQRQAADDSLARTLYVALLQGVSCSTTPLGSSFNIDATSSLEVTLGMCKMYHFLTRFEVKSDCAAIAEYLNAERMGSLEMALRLASDSGKLDKRRCWKSMAQSLTSLAAKDGLQVEITAELESASCSYCQPQLLRGLHEIRAPHGLQLLQRRGFGKCYQTRLCAILTAATPRS